MANTRSKQLIPYLEFIQGASEQDLEPLMEREALVEDILKANPTLIFVKSAKAFFMWNATLEAWVNVPTEDLEALIQDITDHFLSFCAVDLKDKESRKRLAKLLKFSEDYTMTRMMKRFRDERDQLIDVLQGGPEGITDPAERAAERAEATSAEPEVPVEEVGSPNPYGGEHQEA